MKVNLEHFFFFTRTLKMSSSSILRCDEFTICHLSAFRIFGVSTVCVKGFFVLKQPATIPKSILKTLQGACVRQQ